MGKQPVTVAEYIKQQIALSEKSQKDIATEAGFKQPNNISMIKDGITKLPINRIPGMAKALNIDPVHLLRLAMREYMPETWTIIEQLVGKSLLSENEQALLELMRKSMRGVEPDMANTATVDALRGVFNEIATAELNDRESAVRATERPRKAAAVR